jgi:cytochrome c oxidase subunit II
MHWLPPNGALRGLSLDHLLGWNLGIVFWLFVGAQALIVVALVRRWASRSGTASTEGMKHSTARYLFVHALPLLAFVGLYLWMLVSSHHLWAASHELNLNPKLRVEVTGAQFQWYFRYPGRDGIFGEVEPKLVSAPEGNPLGLDPADPHGLDDVVSSVLMLPAGEPVSITLRTQDVIHGFFVPGMRLKQDAIPGMAGHLEFTPETPGDYDILCSQVCGLGHYRMQARLRVVSPGEFDAWLSSRERANTTTGAAP